MEGVVRQGTRWIVQRRGIRIARGTTLHRRFKAGKAVDQGRA